ncbi:serine/threonine-protein kinase VRK1-like isoform X2 [Macrosteles quadrilineatus]|uniref:serine/threonine-protein kinase VRK1-like isoform X2 n=1 Tax=Macrosteles quadrilineatus TaxID=74068 RepID=UPI0023E2ABEA|nr:serine/threonine-protein kinase VRK1-like isoform X2 [Macrosteles quadrilineatus]
MAPKKPVIPIQEVPKKRIAPNGVRLPDPISEGELLTDSAQKTWRLGRSIGLGGFGEIYLASDEVNKPVREDAPFVIKVERHTNGPLFVEKNFYIRTAQMEMINEWVARRNMRALGMPHFLGTGSHHYDGEHYRFLVLPRFGLDVEKVFIRQGRKFHVKTAFTLASYIMDALEYIHCHDYIHGDIKGSNLLLGLECQAPVYLLDYGLATRYLYRDGKHKEYRHDERRAHDGTLEFTSRDAHIGVHSRRGDLEILGYNLVQWLCGRLPWEGNTDLEEVKEAKIAAMNNITTFLNNCFKPDHAPAVLHHYLQYVAHLGFETQPDYKYCKRLFRQAIREAGYQDDGKLTFHSHARKTAKKRKPLYEPENKGVCAKKKCVQPSREPCVVKNLNRMTRNVANTLPLLRSKNEFNWAKVLASDPEKMIRKKLHCAAAANKLEQDSPIRLEKSEGHSPDSSLDNPTPAMLAVMSRMRDDVVTTRSGKRSRSESRCPSPVEPSYNTPAMEEVLQRRDKETARTLRVARRNSAKRGSCSKYIKPLKILRRKIILKAGRIRT